MLVAAKVAPTESSAHWRVVLLRNRNLLHWRARLLPSRDFGSSAIRQVGRSAGQYVVRKFRLTRGLPSRTEKIFRLTRMFALQNESFFLLTGGRGSCRAVISASRQIGRSAIRQVRMSAGNFGSQGCSPSRTEKFFCSLEGRAPARPKIFGSPEVRPPERKFFPLTGGRGSCRAVISAGRQFGNSAVRQIGRSGCRQEISAHKDVRRPERKNFSARKDVRPTTAIGRIERLTAEGDSEIRNS